MTEKAAIGMLWMDKAFKHQILIWSSADATWGINSVQAYRVLEQPDRHKDMTKDDFMERHRAWCCSTVPEEALCGISRIWVFSLARRQGVATRMLDTVR